MVWDSIYNLFIGFTEFTTEFVMRIIGLGKGTRARKLIDQGKDYLVTELADEAAKGSGYATVEMPFSFLPKWISRHIVGDVKYLTVVTDPSLGRQIGNYGSYTEREDGGSFDHQVRVPYLMTNILIRADNIVSRNDCQVKQDRSNMKRVMHDEEYVNNIIGKEFDDFLTKNIGKNINLKTHIRKTMIRALGRSILGMETFPEDEEFDDMIELLEEIDEAMTRLEVEKLQKLESKIMKYSKWIYDNNKDTLLGEHSIIPHLIGTDLENINVANAFLVTPNLTKLVYLTVIFFACNSHHQNQLRRYIQNKDEEGIKRVYMELTRLFVPTNIPRFASRETTFKYRRYNDYNEESHKVTFPADTMFYILGRYIRMNPKLFENPAEYNPDRFIDGKLKMNQAHMFPFGIGQRQCPASGSFTYTFWKQVMEMLFSWGEVIIDFDSQHTQMEEIPLHARHIKLQNTYYGIIS